MSEPLPQSTIGQADSTVPADPPSTSWDGIRAVLWIPDPQKRHWWREYYVNAPDPPKPGLRRLGFTP